MREELEAGLKNAIERGSTLEEAIQSFINAGYNPVEVKEAANNISSGVTNIITNQPSLNENKISQKPANAITNVFNPNSPSPSSVPKQPTVQNIAKDNSRPATQPQAAQSPIMSMSQQPKNKSKIKIVIIILIIVLALLLGTMAVLIIFREKLLELLRPSSSLWLAYEI
jgi:hypothetical protein